jgi:hypothetical protein
MEGNPIMGLTAEQKQALIALKGIKCKVDAENQEAYQNALKVTKDHSKIKPPEPCTGPWCRARAELLKHFEQEMG